MQIQLLPLLYYIQPDTNDAKVISYLFILSDWSEVTDSKKKVIFFSPLNVFPSLRQLIQKQLPNTSASYIHFHQDTTDVKVMKNVLSYVASTTHISILHVQDDE